MSIYPNAQDDYAELNPYLALGTVAALGGLTRDTVFLLCRKGVFRPLRNENGKMLIRRAEVMRWLRENDSKWPTRTEGDSKR